LYGNKNALLSSEFWKDKTLTYCQNKDGIKFKFDNSSEFKLNNSLLDGSTGVLFTLKTMNETIDDSWCSLFFLE
jgi:hypothetical protein